MKPFYKEKRLKTDVWNFRHGHAERRCNGAILGEAQEAGEVCCVNIQGDRMSKKLGRKMSKIDR